jgi:hypothetical protein
VAARSHERDGVPTDGYRPVATGCQSCPALTWEPDASREKRHLQEYETESPHQGSNTMTNIDTPHWSRPPQVHDEVVIDRKSTGDRVGGGRQRALGRASLGLGSRNQPTTATDQTVDKTASRASTNNQGAGRHQPMSSAAIAPMAVDRVNG